MKEEGQSHTEVAMTKKVEGQRDRLENATHVNFKQNMWLQRNAGQRMRVASRNQKRQEKRLSPRVSRKMQP